MAGERPGPVLVLGAGGHAKVVIETLRAAGWTVAGVLDRDPHARQVAGVPVIGADADLPRLRDEGLALAIVALGDNALRARLGEELGRSGFELVNAVHPAAAVSPSVRLGGGVAVMAGACLNAEARVGALAIVNTGARVDHDCDLGEACHVAPGATLAGEVRVGARALVGTGASVIPGIRIGEDAVVGAGAAVVRDVPAHATVVGVPGSVVRASGPRSLQA